MTKVIISQSLFEYQQAMAELLEQVSRETSPIGSVNRQETQELLSPRTEVLELCMPGLLAHPRVEMLWPDLWLKEGHLDGIIQIHTSEYYGVTNVYVTLDDEQGNRIESGGYAMDNEHLENHWGYIPSTPAVPGTTIVVRAVAMDCLGGVSTQTERVTV
jgi:hypothetical protein